MGAGKSTIGRHLSSLLGLSFVDADHELEARCGADIPWIFDIEGEEGFRNREAEVIRDLSQQTGLLIATGGGVVLREENRINLSRAGTVIYLMATPEQIYRRVSQDQSRPLLQVDDPKQAIRNIVEARDPLYRQIADFNVSTGGRGGAQQTAKRIAQRIQSEAITLT